MKFPRTLQWRITLAFTALIILTLGVASFYLVTVVRSSYLTNLETRLEHEARLVAEGWRTLLLRATGYSCAPSGR